MGSPTLVFSRDCRIGVFPNDFLLWTPRFLMVKHTRRNVVQKLFVYLGVVAGGFLFHSRETIFNCSSFASIRSGGGRCLSSGRSSVRSNHLCRGCHHECARPLRKQGVGSARKGVH